MAFVISANLKSRHLNESQRAMIAAKLANIEPSKHKDASPIGEAVSTADAAAMVNVGKRSADRARRVRSIGTKEVVQAVESGALPVGAALRPR